MTRLPRPARAIVRAIVWIAAAGSLPASSALVWELAPPPGAEIAPTRGVDRLEAIAVGADGRLTLAAGARRIFPGETDPPPPVVWALEIDSAGNLWVGTGHSGGLVRIDARGTTADAFESSQLGVRALAVNRDGGVFAGTFPGGAVYRAREGSDPEVWFDPEERYIWAMSPGPDGDLYVATGLHGIIFRAGGSEKGEILLDTDEAHVTALAVDAGGRILAGTDPGGQVIRIVAPDRREVLLDSELREISALIALPDGTIFAGAISEEPVRPPTPANRPDRNELTIEVADPDEGTVLEETGRGTTIRIDLADLIPAPAREGDGSASRLYRIDPDGAPRIVWKSDTERILALAHHARHGVVFGTMGPEGARIHRIEGDGISTQIHQFAEPQVTALRYHRDGRLYAATANPGRVHVIEADGASSGLYESRVIDAGRAARWGSLMWEGDVPAGTRIEVMTRTGNTMTPDASWSSWSPPSPASRGGAISSPAARYLQWRAALSRLQTPGGPSLRNVRVTMLPHNRPPSVSGVRVLNRGNARQATDPGKERDGKGEAVDPPSGARWITWEARDPDGDVLSHSLWIRSDAGEDTRLADAVKETSYAWDDAKTPEGRYRIRIEATDAISTGARALEATAISRSFLVDRTPPTLTIDRAEIRDGRLRVEATAADATGRIEKAEFGLGPAGSVEWTPLPCEDGICDTSRETLRLEREAPPGGVPIRLRVHDEAGNAVTVEVPGS